MATLSGRLRSKLERVVVEARDVAETGAKEALEALAVHHHKYYDHMIPETRLLRQHLRARARQLGDKQDKSGKLDMQHIIHECGYEYWHRMLFARFLAENDLLIDSEMNVPITLKECEELAHDVGIDKWIYASRCAQDMLPQIFRADDPVLKVPFAANHRIKLESLLDGLAQDTFKSIDAIGWVYQFWQSKKKKEVNASGSKIGADELPAVTQLFTEDYMVDFLLDNTLGAWWAGKTLTAKDAESANSEEELRNKVALSNCSWTYLRFKKGSEMWRPAAGTYSGWPKTVAELKCLDPCCGSGHFLVAMLDRLVPMRMLEEDLSKADAVRAVLHDNIHGLEIDPRCTQLAAFALALAAWKMAPETVKEPFPQLNIACCGMEIEGTKEEWCSLAPGNNFVMSQIYDLFRNASTLGSLIDPASQVKDADANTNLGILKNAILQGLEDFRKGQDFEHQELGVTGGGLITAFLLLGDEYHLVSTNVPYLARGKHAPEMKGFIDVNFPRGKQDLATAFLERTLNFCSRNGTVSVVLPHYWLFLQTYKDLRTLILQESSIEMIARLGAGAFETISGEVVNVCLAMLTRAPASDTSEFIGVDISEVIVPAGKARELKDVSLRSVSQRAQYQVPDHRITFEQYEPTALLREHAQGLHGQGCFDVPCFVFNFWEVNDFNATWELQQSTAEQTTEFAGCTNAFRWENGKGLLANLMACKKQEGYSSGKWKAGVSAWGKRGIAVSGMSRLYFTLYQGKAYDENVSVILPEEQDLVPAIWSYCLSGEFEAAVRTIDQKYKVTCNTLVKVPFDEQKWRKEASKRFPLGLPEPTSNRIDQWLFHGKIADADLSLHVACARLLGYCWPQQDKDDMATFADKDGIVCVPSVRGEEPAADRLLAILRKAYGDDWTDTKVLELITETGSKAKSLEKWLRDEFFEQHCKLFHHRPFIWHIWDGRKRDGFHALVNYHKLAEGNGEGRKVLEKLTHSYLGEWITRQKDGVARSEGGAEDRLAAAIELQNRLLAILMGEPPFDIFVRWKPLLQQSIGWNPDLNDGVRMNIRPFMAGDLPNGKKGAGILRWKPNIKWGKDRGKEPNRPNDEYPWFWAWDESTQDFIGGTEFDGNRWNDLHYTNAAKEAARKRSTQNED